MRHWLLALMIALLPLRGWVGDAMALSLVMPAGTVQAATTPPCHGHEDAATSVAGADAPGTAQASAPEGTHSHGACSVCHAPALTPLALRAISPQAAPPAAAPASVRFSSCEPRRDAKPPIA